MLSDVHRVHPLDVSETRKISAMHREKALYFAALDMMANSVFENLFTFVSDANIINSVSRNFPIFPTLLPSYFIRTLSVTH
jgi:hypothetical protein